MTAQKAKIFYSLILPQGLVFFLIRFMYYQKPMESGFFGALLTVIIALSQNKEHFVTVYFATAGLILVISLIETAHTMAYQDELTSLPGRRALKEYLLKLGGRLYHCHARYRSFQKI